MLGAGREARSDEETAGRGAVDNGYHLPLSMPNFKRVFVSPGYGFWVSVLMKGKAMVVGWLLPNVETWRKVRFQNR